MMMHLTSNFRWSLFLLIVNLVATTQLVRGQEAPLFNVTTITSNETFRTNFCERHRQVESGEIPLRDALKGLNLRPAIFRYQLDKDTGAIDEVHPPIGIVMLDEIARRAKFEYRNSYGVIDSPGENQTWGDVLSWSIDTYDLNGDWYLRTVERLNDGILFPEKWYDGSLIMIRKPAEKNGSFDWDRWLLPFTDGVWWLIIATTILSGLVFYAIECIGYEGDRSEMEITAGRSVFEQFLNMTGQYISEPSQPGNCIVAFSTCFLFLIILATYTANMTSFLVIENTPDVVINEIQDVIKNDLSLCLMKGTAADTLMTERYDMARIVPKESILDSYVGLDNGDCDVALTTISTWQSKKLDIVHNKDCRKEWMGREVQNLDAGFSLRDSNELCSSLLRDVITLHLGEMKADRTFQKIWDTERAKSETNNCANINTSNEDDLDTIRMSVKNVGGIFIFHGALMLVGFTVSLLAMYHRKRKAKLAQAGAEPKQSRLPKYTTRLESVSSSRDESVFDLELSEEDNVGNNNKQLDYIALMQQQMKCMESMQKEMKVMQEQLAQLTEQRKTPSPPNLVRRKSQLWL